MNNAQHKLLCGDVGIVVVLALYGLIRQRDCLLGAVLQAAEALDAVSTEFRLAVNEFNITLRAQLLALVAAYAGIGNGKFFSLECGKLWPYEAFKCVKPHLRRCISAHIAAKDSLCNLLCLALTALLSCGRRHRRKHKLMREQPYCRALVRNAGPEIELEALVNLVQAAAEISGVLADCKCVCRRRNFNLIEVSLNVSGQTAAVAGDG